MHSDMTLPTTVIEGLLGWCFVNYDLLVLCNTGY